MLRLIYPRKTLWRNELSSECHRSLNVHCVCGFHFTCTAHPRSHHTQTVNMRQSFVCVTNHSTSSQAVTHMSSWPRRLLTNGEIWAHGFVFVTESFIGKKHNTGLFSILPLQMFFALPAECSSTRCVPLPPLTRSISAET